jgi:hypothetical protein
MWQDEKMLLTNRTILKYTLGLFAAAAIPGVALAQGLGPDQLDRLVDRIALYPDPLLAQTLAGATYSDEIPDADMWANQHKYLHGDELARAITDDHLPWDPSVQALLPFPNVLHMMASDMGWTRQLGDAFLAQHNEVMDAVQRDRQKAYDFGYLRTNSYCSVVVSGPRAIVINPLNPGLIYVPTYDPLVVYARPRPGFVIGGAIGFGVGFSIGAAFAPWGWGGARFDWGGHGIFVNNRPWVRVAGNRTTYVHPYDGGRRWEPARRVEPHRLEEHREPHGRVEDRRRK